MIPLIDLHVHSDFSSCPVSMQEVVFEAKEAGLKTIGFTDHYDKILDNSSFEKYVDSLNSVVKKTNFLNVKKGVEFELHLFEQLKKDLVATGQPLDYLLYHDFSSFDEFCRIVDFQSQVNIPVIAAHPHVGEWSTPNEDIIDFLNKNKIIFEINKTHLSFLKGFALEKEKDFFKMLVKEKDLRVSFGSDYHKYGAFQTTNFMFEKIYTSIDLSRIFLFDSKKAHKEEFKEPFFDDEIIEKRKLAELVNQCNGNLDKNTEKVIAEIFKKLSDPLNNCGLNMFYVQQLEKIGANNSKLAEKIAFQIKKEYFGSKNKDTRRHSYKAIFNILGIKIINSSEWKNIFEKQLNVEPSSAVKKLLKELLAGQV